MIPLIHLCRLHRPIGIVLLMLPCWWGAALAFPQKGVDFYQTLFLFLIGAASLRSAGCVVNDWIDRKYDRNVVRTNKRPLVLGTVTASQALFLFVLMMGIGGVVWLCLNSAAKFVSMIGLCLLFIYPFMKRLTYWPQLVLGLAFNIGVLIACADVSPTLLARPEVWLLYATGILWTLAYDTIYAFQDVQDDLRLGLKSTALLFQNYPYTLPLISYGGMFACLGVLGYLKQAQKDYFCFLGVSFLISFICLKQWQPKKPDSCNIFFKANALLGFLVFFALCQIVQR